MELQEFIKNTLVQVSKGVEDAKIELGEKIIGKTIINPEPYKHLSFAEEGGVIKRVEEIEFDIALIVEQKTEGKAGIGVLASIITAGASKSSGDINSATHRIKFKVPIKFV